MPEQEPAAAPGGGAGHGQEQQQQQQQEGGGSTGEEGSQSGEAAFMEAALRALSKAGRFALNVRLLGAKGKAAVQQLFQDLEELAAAPPACADEQQARLQELWRLYGLAGK